MTIQALTSDPASSVVPPPARAPREKEGAGPGAVPHHRIAVLGAGFAGIGMAIKLLGDGERDFVVIDRGGEVGGTWRDNTYPGCQCDVPSNLYSFSFAPNPNWGRQFAWQKEIFEYLKQCADRYGVRPHLWLGTELQSAAWDESAQLWRIQTTRGPLTANVLISGHGGLSAPQVPDVPGLESFKGAVFHSAAWRHDYSLEGKRVAVVGTGASAIQIVPSIQPKVKALVLFQRTPPWIMPRLDRDVSEARKRWYRFFPIFQLLSRLRQYFFRELVVLGLHGRYGIMSLLEWVANQHRAHQVKDPALREILTPRYALGCKRMLISNDYYPALTQENVRVVSGAVRSVTEHGVVGGDGKEHPVDAIVMCTGFRVTDHPVAGLLRGRDGRTLAEHWADGAYAYLGTTVPNFPNLFLITGPNTGLGHTSMVIMMEAQFAYILGALHELGKPNAGALDVRTDVALAFAEEMRSMSDGTAWSSGCTSWYLDSKGRNTSVWPTFTFRFRNRTRRFDVRAYSLEPRRVAHPVSETAAA